MPDKQNRIRGGEASRNEAAGIHVRDLVRGLRELADRVRNAGTASPFCEEVEQLHWLAADVYAQVAVEIKRGGKIGEFIAAAKAPEDLENAQLMLRNTCKGIFALLDELRENKEPGTFADRLDGFARELHPLTGQKSPRRKRQQRQQRTPTGKQMTAMQAWADCEGNYTAAAKRLGLSRATVKQHIEAAYRKLGEQVPKMPRTRALPEDSRGNAAVDRDRRSG